MGKHFLIGFNGVSIKTYFLQFSTCRINEKDSPTKLGFVFKQEELNFQTSTAWFIEEDLDTLYEWSDDVLNDVCDSGRAKLR